MVMHLHRCVRPGLVLATRGNGAALEASVEGARPSPADTAPSQTLRSAGPGGEFGGFFACMMEC